MRVSSRANKGQFTSVRFGKEPNNQQNQDNQDNHHQQ